MATYFRRDPSHRTHNLTGIGIVLGMAGLAMLIMAPPPVISTTTLVSEERVELPDRREVRGTAR